MDKLVDLRKNATIGEVLDHLKQTKRPRLTDRVAKREDEIATLGSVETADESNSLKRHRKLRNVAYSEIVALVEFINGFTPFATQHSVKGAEFENVLVILSGGWNQYNWPKYLELRHTGIIAAKDQGGYYRARNLFYVALSRPKKRLAILATQELNANAVASAVELFGEEHVIPLSPP
ncbi:3'-5' exonuclease [Methylosinus sp. PW1]|uniref:3'-5' exonuclease n=1 Tax=Methylosinus sp. PW1 TaxID=107636 RepID=UPI00056785FF|nr:3'-5' exonuclease [Methylosinus sp. PW1]